jgi:4-amino-4-deoxy-L-arabinose transferase-like glycosyltransferase
MVPRWVQWGLALVVLAVAAGLILIVALSTSGGGVGNASASPTPAAGSSVLTAYVDALRGPTREGGQVIEQLLKPSISEFASGQVDAATFTARARGWVLSLQKVKRELAAIRVPPVIASAGPLFDQAMDGYVHTAQVLEQAAAVPESQRVAALDQGRQAGRDADAVYDRAAALVQRALRAAGLPPDSALPDLTPSPG